MTELQPGSRRPRVSVITPCYNEERSIGLLLQAVADQTTAPSEVEMIVADGRSTDRSLQVIRAFAERHPGFQLRVIENPARTIPAGLNRALREARGEIVVRLDAHSIPAPDYLDRCLAVLRSTNAANVGGAWDIRPSSQGWPGRSIAAAVSHPLGAGDARYRTGGRAGPADTVPFGAYPRRWLEKVGGYDETLAANEDYDLNVRLRGAGGLVWFDPAIRSVYFARGDFGSLARQYARYGFWKARMLLRQPRSLRWRQAAAPLLVLSLLAQAVLAPFWRLAAWSLALESSVYLMTLLLVATRRAWKDRDPSLAIGIPLAWTVVHGAWGVGFWRGLLSGAGRPAHGGRHGGG